MNFRTRYASLAKALLFLLLFTPSLHALTWGERLGFPKDKKVLILHADDLGLCEEANHAADELLKKGLIESMSVMPVAPRFKSFVSKDLGIHLVLTSEWKTVRWGPLAPSVPSLVDKSGFLWKNETLVEQNATLSDIERETRAQIEKALAAGIKPTHLDSHMGDHWQNASFAATFLKAAKSYGIPTFLIEPQDKNLPRYEAAGFAVPKPLIEVLRNAPGPKVDDFYLTPFTQTYDDKKKQTLDWIKTQPPGIIQVIFHPTKDGEQIRAITPHWRQRVWDYELLKDKDFRNFLKNEGILLTTWRELSERQKKTIP